MMRYPEIISLDSIADHLSQFDCVIDVRSPAEFAEDHIPGAINCPVLDNEERILVGTTYKQVDSFEAKRLGASFIATNIGKHLATQFKDKPKIGDHYFTAGAAATVVAQWHIFSQRSAGPSHYWREDIKLTVSTLIRQSLN